MATSLGMKPSVYGRSASLPVQPRRGMHNHANATSFFILVIPLLPVYPPLALVLAGEGSSTPLAPVLGGEGVGERGSDPRTASLTPPPPHPLSPPYWGEGSKDDLMSCRS